MSNTEKFHCHPANEIEELININIKAMTNLTSKIIPHMLERKQKSAIVNLSSFTIQCPFNGLAVYTATKAYNDLFSRCLSEDYLGTASKI
jgi:17beta-estradiol 17-dehydrogenase / very-long-chain 3-oxoacyl-CoA reductase